MQLRFNIIFRTGKDPSSNEWLLEEVDRLQKKLVSEQAYGRDRAFEVNRLKIAAGERVAE